jgi:hypothetical protein
LTDEAICGLSTLSGGSLPNKTFVIAKLSWIRLNIFQLNTISTERVDTDITGALTDNR